MLTPDVYDTAERQAAAQLPVRIIQSFSTAGFAHVGYPTHTSTLPEVARYINALGSVDFSRLGQGILGGVSPEEMELAETVCRHACEMSLEMSGKRRIPAGSILSSILALRHVRLMFPDPGATTILEIGPGDGCLGAMLILLGYNYIGTDAAQAFYLVQSNLFARIAGNRFVELVTDDRDLISITKITNGMALHVPWWKFGNGRPDSINLILDCVFGAAVFCEMHQFALGYLAHQARRWLDRSKGIAVAFGPGEPASVSIPRMIDIFKGAGFDLIHSDKHGAQDIDFTAIGQTPWSIDVGHYFRPAGEKSQMTALIKGRERMRRASNNLHVSEFYDRLRPLLQGSPLESPDELFLRFCTRGEMTEGIQVPSPAPPPAAVVKRRGTLQRLFK